MVLKTLKINQIHIEKRYKKIGFNEYELFDKNSGNNDQYVLSMYIMPGIVLTALQISSGLASQQSYKESTFIIMPILQINSQGWETFSRPHRGHYWNCTLIPTMQIHKHSKNSGTFPLICYFTPSTNIYWALTHSGLSAYEPRMKTQSLAISPDKGGYSKLLLSQVPTLINWQQLSVKCVMYSTAPVRSETNNGVDRWAKSTMHDDVGITTHVSSIWFPWASG